MHIFAIADLHREGGCTDKSMTRFGGYWKNHFEKISKDWQEKVSDEDIVLVVGDTSWATKFHNAREDICNIASLGGRVIFSRGNHDYWWESPSNMKEDMPKNIEFIQNDNIIELENTNIIATRGWSLNDESEHGKKMLEREKQRLLLGLNKAANNGKEIIVMMHYPPLQLSTKGNMSSVFTELFKEYNVTKCVYGHLHCGFDQNAFNGIFENVEYSLVSCDTTDFKLTEIVNTNNDLVTKVVKNGTIPYFTNDLVNDLTKEMDKYLLWDKEDGPPFPAHTYIYDDIRYHRKVNQDRSRDWGIRFPGATRGCIKTDKHNIITSIWLSEETGNIYKPEVVECFEKYIGKRLVTTERIKK